MSGRATASDRLAICLSGGGYRAMLFHVGAMRRLGEVGLLATVDRVSAVSGGSIAAGILAMHWKDLEFGSDGVPSRFEAVERDVFDLAGHTIDWPGALRGVIGSRSAATGVAHAYDRLLFDGLNLQDLPDVPRFVFNSVNLQTGVLLRWAKPYAADYLLGRIDAPSIPLATVVAASSAFPPFLTPQRIRPPGVIVDPETNVPVAHPPARLWLGDGGIYDNLGLQAVERFETVLVSDGGAPLDRQVRLRTNWLSQSERAWKLADSQVRGLRKRHLINQFEAETKRGALWAITTDIADFTAADMLVCPTTATAALARVKTRLKRLPMDLRYQLANWGYAVTDGAIRSHVNSALPAPTVFPYPGGVG